MHVNTSIEVAGVLFSNPVIAASGTYGFGREYGEYIDLNKLGGISVKGITLEPRAGNRTPRIAETPSGMLNSVGLQNPGIDEFIRNEVPFLRQYSTKIIVNIAGSTVEEYIEMARRLEDADIDMIEVNVSCPNVRKGCVAFGMTEKGIEEVTYGVKKSTSHPVMVKLTPNVSDIGSLAHAAESAGADAVSLINTITGMVIDVNTRRPLLYNNTGGLSGPAVRPVAVRMVHEVRKRVNIPIIGMGGICNAEDALQFIIAGASAIMVGTANFMNPGACIETADGIEGYMKTNGIKMLGELVGSLKLNGV